MKKTIKAALYDPYLDVLGGGERHVLSIMQVLANHGYEIDIFWDSDLSTQIKERLNISFPVHYQPNIFKHKGIFDKLNFLSKYDIFIYVTNGSYFFSSAKKTLVYAMVPQKNLYPTNYIDKLKLNRTSFFANSSYVQHLLSKWNIKSTVVTPYIDNEIINIELNNIHKEQIILTVGRFFKHLHSKRQDKAIESFNKLKQKYHMFNNFKLILAGGMKEEDKSYFSSLQEMANNDPNIIFKPNIDYTDLIELYKNAAYYWHFGGYGVDEETHPEYTEHFGITPLEAMSAGCITCCYKAGGPAELIQDGVTGILFTSVDELIQKMQNIHTNENKKAQMISAAKEYVTSHFSYSVFEKNVINYFMK